ncbi:MAG: DUF3160 domain-containing protein [Planctomycetes bacterium]|nr:DUF3160 domain-containing protein [Planctomycetota bacterium]
MRRIMLALCLLAALAAVSSTTAQDAPPPEEPKKPKAWQERAAKNGWTEAEIKAFAADRVRVTNETFKQIFSAYVAAPLPVFITSDAVLNAYHVLLEESVMRLEIANARELKWLVGYLWTRLLETKPDAEVPEFGIKGLQRAKIVVAVAIKLLELEIKIEDETIRKSADDTVKLVLAATGEGKPAWLGKPDPGFLSLDWQRFKPRGFYTKRENLQRHFRALSWFQSIPFRLVNDEELAAIAWLRDALHTNYKESRANENRGKRLVQGYSAFLGTGDDLDITKAPYEFQVFGKDELKEFRERFVNECFPAVNDQLRYLPDDPTQVAEPHYRVISAYRLPDAVMFGRSTDLRTIKRDWPSGLEVAAALGSEFAAKQLPQSDREKVLPIVEASKPLFKGTSIYAQYMNTLRTLVDKPEPDAPEFMSKELWQAKNCNTLLASWAQMRHTWALQAKDNAYWRLATKMPAGFVEPEPEFYCRLAGLVHSTASLLKDTPAFEPDTEGLAEMLRRAKEAIAKFKLTERSALEVDIDGMTGEDSRMLDMGESFARVLLGLKDTYWYEKAGAKVLAEKLGGLADDVAAGKFDLRQQYKQLLWNHGQDCESLWPKLEQICRRLETLAHKQLRKIKFNEDEEKYILDFGGALGECMMYIGNSWLFPFDDAPRACGVFANHELGAASGYLHVGVDRPRAIYVLYPSPDGDVLCRGAIMPYREFVHATPLTDTEFQALLDSDRRPNNPEWFKALPGAVKIGKNEPVPSSGRDKSWRD